MKNIYEMTREELDAIEYGKPSSERIYGIVILPRKEIHDSGFNCMDFVLLGGGAIPISKVGGCSDVIHINGIGGYGDYETSSESIRTGKIDVASWRIDCLPKSNCLRLFVTHGSLKIPDFIGSDFEVYAEKSEKERKQEDEKN